MPQFITPVDITPGVQGSWEDVDLSDYIPAEAIGIICKLSQSSNYLLGIRTNGSTDTPYAMTRSIGCAHIGVDSRIIELYYSAPITGVDIILTGYYVYGEAVFFTNKIDKSSGLVADAFVDIDITDETDGGETPLVVMASATVNYAYTGIRFHLRASGSTDDYHLASIVWGYNGRVYEGNIVYNASYFSVTSDVNGLFEAYVGEIITHRPKLYIHGYIRDPAAVNTYTNWSEYTVDPAEFTWTDLNTGITGQVVGATYFRKHGYVSGLGIGYRRKGDTEDYPQYPESAMCPTAGCDAYGLIQIYTEGSPITFYKVVEYTGLVTIPVNRHPLRFYNDAQWKRISL